NGSQVGTTSTDGTGHYQFADVVPGSYYLVFTAPPQTSFTLQDQGGDDTRDSDVNSMGWTATFSVAAGQNRSDLDAGLAPKAQVGDFVWQDANANGVQDMGEQGVTGVMVTLYAANGMPMATTATDGTG